MAHAKICDRCGAFFKPYNNKVGEYNGVRRIRTGKNSSDNEIKIPIKEE